MNNTLLYILSFILAMIFMILSMMIFNSKNQEDALSPSLILKSIIRLKETENIVIWISSFFGLIVLMVSFLLYKRQWYEGLIFQSAAMMLALISYTDFKQRVIPNRILLIGLIFAAGIKIASMLTGQSQSFNLLVNAFIGALVGGGVFLLASFFSKGGIGAGDIKLFTVLGFMLGLKGVFNVLLYTLIISALTGIVLMLTKKKKIRDTLPLAPFALIGFITAIIWGVL